eukprot:Filipodium_phascolosomae@DN3174_c0_g1_i1.p1
MEQVNLMTRSDDGNYVVKANRKGQEIADTTNSTPQPRVERSKKASHRTRSCAPSGSLSISSLLQELSDMVFLTCTHNTPEIITSRCPVSAFFCLTPSPFGPKTAEENAVLADGHPQREVERKSWFECRLSSLCPIEYNLMRPICMCRWWVRIGGKVSDDEKSSLAKLSKNDLLAELLATKQALGEERLMNFRLSWAEVEVNKCRKQIDVLNQQLQVLATENMCKVCSDKRWDCMLKPCAHTNICQLCASNLKTCPFCRKPIKSVIILKNADTL